MTSAELVYDPDPHLWLVGPTDERPRDEWIRGAIQVMVEDFEAANDDERQFIAHVLRAFVDDDSSPLTERLLRWRNLEDDPFPVRLGMVEREFWSEESLRTFLEFSDEATVEPAIVEPVAGRPGTTIRRGIAYTRGGDVLHVSARYVIETGSKDFFAVIQASTDVPAQLIEALEDFDDLARTVDVKAAGA